MALAVATFAYLLFITLVCIPMQWVWPARKREIIAAALALMSTCALPWTGISLFAFAGVGSHFWFPTAGLAVLLAKTGKGRAWGDKGILILSVSLLAGVCTLFMYQEGVPGDLASLEGLAVIFRLESLRNSRMLSSAPLFLLGSLLAFAQISFENTLTARLISFTYAAFLINVFLPVKTAWLWHDVPTLAILADASILFAVVVGVQRVILPSLSAWLKTRKNRRAHTLTPLCFIAVACYFLITSQ